jgi:hypothetical protein
MRHMQRLLSTTTLALVLFAQPFVVEQLCVRSSALTFRDVFILGCSRFGSGREIDRVARPVIGGVFGNQNYLEIEDGREVAGHETVVEAQQRHRRRLDVATVNACCGVGRS